MAAPDPELTRLLRVFADTTEANARAHAAALRHIADRGDFTSAAVVTAAVAGQAPTAAVPKRAGTKRCAPDSEVPKAATARAKASRTFNPIAESVWKHHFADVVAWHDEKDTTAQLVLRRAPSRGKYEMTTNQMHALMDLGVKDLVITNDALLSGVGTNTQDNTTLRRLHIGKHCMQNINPTISRFVALEILFIGSTSVCTWINLNALFTLRNLHTLVIDYPNFALLEKLGQLPRIRRFRCISLPDETSSTGEYATMSPQNEQHWSAYNDFSMANNLRDVFMECPSLENVGTHRDDDSHEINEFLRYRVIIKCSSAYYGARSERGLPLALSVMIAKMACPGVVIDLDKLYLPASRASTTEESFGAAEATSDESGAAGAAAGV